jgi:3-hydroxyisobutyrate dehydrogenase-like beta-hydroxyacid dehydrogenase
MGVRLSKNLANADTYTVHVEVSPEGRARLKAELGFECQEAYAALEGVDVIVLAVPDTAIKKIAASTIDRVPSGAMTGSGFLSQKKSRPALKGSPDPCFFASLVAPVDMSQQRRQKCCLQ